MSEKCDVFFEWPLTQIAQIKGKLHSSAFLSIKIIPEKMQKKRSDPNVNEMHIKCAFVRVLGGY